MKAKQRFTWSTEPQQILTSWLVRSRYVDSRHNRSQLLRKQSQPDSVLYKTVNCWAAHKFSSYLPPVTTGYWVVYYAGIVCKNASSNIVLRSSTLLSNHAVWSLHYFFDSNNLMWKCNIECAVPIPVHTGFCIFLAAQINFLIQKVLLNE